MNVNKSKLSVENLKTHFFTRAGVVKAVDGVSFTIEAGKILGLVGESGSGKSVTGMSILDLIDEPGRVVGGRIFFNGNNIVGLPENEMRRLRGRRISMIFQDAMMTLNPVLRIETQMIEALCAHQKITRKKAFEQSLEALIRVGIPSAKNRMRAYPHQFSGGMRQRVAIATAMLNKPDLIIADEPTTALDVTIQAQILFETQKLCREQGTALIWITHDLTVVAGLADEVCVMYAGKIVEHGTVDEVLDRPCHPYTKGLIASVPSHNRRGRKISQIQGMAPSLLNLPPGCAFRERCPRADDKCKNQPEMSMPLSGHSVCCFHPHEDL